MLIFVPNLFVLGEHALIKKRCIRVNQKHFMDKEINQAILLRYEHRNMFFKLTNAENRHVCVYVYDSAAIALNCYSNRNDDTLITLM